MEKNNLPKLISPIAEWVVVPYLADTLKKRREQRWRKLVLEKATQYPPQSPSSVWFVAVGMVLGVAIGFALARFKEL